MIRVRRATLTDLDTLVTFRVALFTEMGQIASDADAARLAALSRSYFTEALATGAFLGWLAEASGAIVASGGAVRFQRPPSPANPSGNEMYIMNMYTRPHWRGRGVATALLEAIIAEVRATDARRIWLHATEAGRAVYERAGFRGTTSDMELVW